MVSEDPKEEEDVPLKRKRISSVDKGKQVQTQTQTPAFPRGTSSVGDGLF